MIGKTIKTLRPCFWYLTNLKALRVLNWCDTADSLIPKSSAKSQTHNSCLAKSDSILRRLASPKRLKNSAIFWAFSISNPCKCWNFASWWWDSPQTGAIFSMAMFFPDRLLRESWEREVSLESSMPILVPFSPITKFNRKYSPGVHSLSRQRDHRHKLGNSSIDSIDRFFWWHRRSILDTYRIHKHISSWWQRSWLLPRNFFTEFSITSEQMFMDWIKLNFSKTQTGKLEQSSQGWGE